MSQKQNNWSVLVVDDEPLTQDLLRLMLEPAGFHVSGADDGEAALRLVKETLPDVMILDVMMPDMDGIAVCKHLRDDVQTAHLPIIMFSGKTHLHAVEEGLEAGANRYLAKPMSRTDLIQNLREVLSESSMAQLF